VARSAPPSYRDFGPPEGCGAPWLPDTRMGWFTNVTSTTVYVPIVAFTANDAEDAAERAAEYDRITMRSSWPKRLWPYS
jgi:hypothetical protein